MLQFVAEFARQKSLPTHYSQLRVGKNIFASLFDLLIARATVGLYLTGVDLSAPGKKRGSSGGKANLPMMQCIFVMRVY